MVLPVLGATRFGLRHNLVADLLPRHLPVHIAGAVHSHRLCLLLFSPSSHALHAATPGPDIRLIKQVPD